MSTQTTTSDNAMFNIGWIVLLFISALATLNHIMLPLYGDPLVFALGWTGYSLYATVVIAIPFRRCEKWAWYISWILVVGFAYPILIIRESYTVAYLIAAGVIGLCLLLTRPAFFRKEV